MSFATKAKKLSQITKIYSKDKGFGQCREFLQEHNLFNVEQIPVESTAKAAILAAENPNSAAICSHIAAKLYGVPTMFDHVEDDIGSQTRFVILSDFKNERSEDDKTSILVRLKDSVKAGSLVHFLQDFDEKKINFSKIESRPLKEKGGFDYLFFMDFYGHIDDENVQEVLQKHKEEVTWLGSYVKGEEIEV
jgi:chorismate mutase/prephenate dehydratase